MLSCQKCGAECKLTAKAVYGKSELGFSVRENIYKCEKCGAEHILCPECEGNKFIDHYDPQDCDVCYGMGVVEVERIAHA